MGRLDGKVAIVTGGSQGLGASAAEAMVREGAKVAVASRNLEALEQVATRLGPNALPVQLDVTDHAQWEQAVAATVETFGHLDCLVNNAGIANFNHIEDYTVEQWQQAIDVNLNSVFYGTKAALPALKRSSGGSIINVSSVAGFRAAPNLPGYVTTKFAVRGLTKSVALDLGAYAIRVNSIHPGAFHTPLTEGLDMSQRHVALKRGGEPWEFANLVVFLASDEAPFLTGAEIAIDGGEAAGRMKY